MGQIWDILRSVSVHFCPPSQNVLKLILKSPRFVPFRTNLTQFACQIKQPCDRQTWSLCWDVRSRHKLGQICTKWNTSGTFYDRYQYILTLIYPIWCESAPLYGQMWYDCVSVRLLPDDCHHKRYLDHLLSVMSVDSQ